MKFKFYLLLTVVALSTYSCKKQKNTEPVEEIIEEAKLDETVPAIIPHIYIETANSQEITSKTDYIIGTVKIDGKGVNSDLAVSTMKVRGRGNSTWNKPKKPYRIKLDKAAAVLGLQSAKDWVLLANYQDYTFMTNAVAMKIGQQLNMPFTNTIIPVDLTVNGVYLGNYNLTEQIEVKAGRINIGNDGVLLEMDSYFDEDYQFKSAGYALPVMVKYPDIETPTQFNGIKKNFEDFEALLKSSNFPGNNYGNAIDKQQVVNYLIAYNLSGNFEMNHPKSVYMHKAANGKYTMGPIWDFDWGFGFDEVSRKYFNYNTMALLRAGDSRPGAAFFNRFMSDPEIRSLYKSTWTNYKDAKFNDLLKYIEQYAASIRESQKKDYNIWKVGDSDLAKSKKDLKVYLRTRANYITSYVSTL